MISVISFLIGMNLGWNLNKYFKKENTIIDLLIPIIIVFVWLLYCAS